MKRMRKLAKLLRAWAERLDPAGRVITDAPMYRGEPMNVVHLRQRVDISKAAHPDARIQQDNVVYLMEKTEEALGETASQCVRWSEKVEGPGGSHYMLAELVILRYNDDGPR